MPLKQREASWYAIRPAYSSLMFQPRPLFVFFRALYFPSCLAPVGDEKVERQEGR